MAGSAGDRAGRRARPAGDVRSDVSDPALDADAARAEARLNAFLERYYGQPAELLRRRQASYAGPAEGVAAWLDGNARAGAGHLVLLFAGEHERHLEAVAAVRRTLGW